MVYNFGGENLSSELLFEYEGELSIKSNIIADWHGNALNAEISIIPNDFSLNHPYPNPFNPTTTIKFGLPEENNVNIAIYNMQGRQVAELFDGHLLEGYHTITWEASQYSSGIYFVKMAAGEHISTQKLMLVK